ncbi:hypothetical protein GDO78_015107 [Eleutherodactylus coqui]|uniref:Uncharacterized protein n=1 Tax=Eleutherodactylus coqui TaxID=57060 RepID=A0A8J6K139_ELECQ|nr:hypothetical protein GDO78_015107 [Eleutherodactylus coqui]
MSLNAILKTCLAPERFMLECLLCRPHNVSCSSGMESYKWQQLFHSSWRCYTIYWLALVILYTGWDCSTIYWLALLH